MAHVGPLTAASVLVVEDHADSRDLFCKILTLAGANTNCVGSLAKAITSVRTAKPDAVVADLRVASRDFLLIRQIRHEVGSVPAICLASDSREKDRERALEAGFDVFLVKPVLPDDLVAAIEGVLIPRGA